MGHAEMRNVNLALHYLLERFMLAGIAGWGFTAGGSEAARIARGVGTPGQRR